MGNIILHLTLLVTLCATGILLPVCMAMTDERFPVYTTFSCPKNHTEWTKRSLALNCNETNGYTCLPNNELTQLMEFCYTQPRIGITKGICLLLYNNSRLKQYSCTSFIDGCPDKFHFSDTVYEYPFCLAIRNGCFLAEPSCSSIPTRNHITSSSTTKPVNTGESSERIDWTWIAIFTVGVLLILCIIFCACVFYRKRKGKVKKKMMKQTAKSEMSSLLQENEEKQARMPTKHIDDEETSFETCPEFRMEPPPNIDGESQEHGISDLYEACKEGNESSVLSLLRSGADVNSCTLLGFSPLLVASLQGHETIVNILIEHKANVNLCGLYGVSPLYAACRKGYDNITNILLKNGADVDLCDEGGFSPLYIACLNGHECVVKILLDNKADVNKHNNGGVSPIYVSSSDGYANIVKLLIDHGANVDSCNPLGYSPLFAACLKGHIDVVQILLENHASVNQRNKYGFSPLFAARLHGHENIAQLLLKKGAD